MESKSLKKQSKSEQVLSFSLSSTLDELEKAESAIRWAKYWLDISKSITKGRQS